MASYCTPIYRPASKPIGVNRVEYAEKNQILKLENEIKDLEIRENAIVKAVGKNQTDIKEIFNRLRNIDAHVDWLEHEMFKMQEKTPDTVAPVVNKRRRRVTVCAYGQKVEIEKI